MRKKAIGHVGAVTSEGSTVRAEYFETETGAVDYIQGLVETNAADQNAVGWLKVDGKILVFSFQLTVNMLHITPLDD